MSNDKTQRRLAALGIAAVVALAGGAVWASANGAEEQTPPVLATDYTQSRQAVPQAASLDEAIALTLAGLDSEAFAEARLGDAPGDQAHKGAWFYATLADADSPLPVSLWEGDLATGAVADRLAKGADNLAEVVAGSSFYATGTREELGGGVGDVVPGQAFSAAGLSDEAIIKSATDELAKAGLSATEVRVLRPLDAALLVRVKVADLAKTPVNLAELQQALMGSPARFEGIYLEISTDIGPVAVSSLSLRTGAGRQWIASGFENAVKGFPTGLAPSIAKQEK
jgi:hypothetical protein